MDKPDLINALRELEQGLVVFDAMVRRDGYTDKAQTFMAELREHVLEIAQLMEEGGK